jgi:hypothetical protein
MSQAILIIVFKDGTDIVGDVEFTSVFRDLVGT